MAFKFLPFPFSYTISQRPYFWFEHCIIPVVIAIHQSCIPHSTMCTRQVIAPTHGCQMTATAQAHLAHGYQMTATPQARFARGCEVGTWDGRLQVFRHRTGSESCSRGDNTRPLLVQDYGPVWKWFSKIFLKKFKNFLFLFF